MNNLLGVHCSVSGGLENSFNEAGALQTDVMQIFTRNQRQWKAKPIGADEKMIFRAAAAASELKVLFSHCSYLINLASENEDIRQKSVEALREEVVRCTELGLSYCVLHPGAAGSRDFNTAMDQIADGLLYVLKATEGSNVQILLENTAGQGTSVGGTFENLAYIYSKVNHPRIAFCFDTCHAFVAGYDLRTEEGCRTTFQHFEAILGLKNLKVFHLNDSKGDLGSHLDRHENIGKGKLGLEPFRYIMNRYKEIPKVIETPKEDDWDQINLGVLRGLV